MEAANTIKQQGLSSRDSKLVDILFSSAVDGEYIRDQITGTYQPYTNTEPSTQSEFQEIDQSTLDLLKARERKAVGMAEKGSIQDAVNELSKIIDDCPHYASAYNNRAQAKRLLRPGASDNDVLGDLDMAIKYADPSGSDGILGQAYTQKGIVYRDMGDQDAAFFCFSQGASHGNEVAKMAAPKENPYAKLCGKIVSDAMKQLRNPTGQQ